jgi:hypothetical protein
VGDGEEEELDPSQFTPELLYGDLADQLSPVLRERGFPQEL